MASLVLLRIVGYIAILIMHITNIVYMEWYGKQSQSKDENVIIYKGLAQRFFTVWTLIMQIAYAFFGLMCDVWILSTSNNYVLPKFVSGSRNVFFACIVWPSTWIVFTVFWPLFKYDRSLILPEYIDNLLPTISNHVIHTMIVPVVLFEVVCRPRKEPRTHKWNLIRMTVYAAMYVCVLLYTYIERNVWMYPIFGILYGTIYFPLTLAAIYLLFWIFYYMQWHINDILHKSQFKNKKLKKERILKKKKII